MTRKRLFLFENNYVFPFTFSFRSSEDYLFVQSDGSSVPPFPERSTKLDQLGTPRQGFPNVCVFGLWVMEMCQNLPLQMSLFLSRASLCVLLSVTFCIWSESANHSQTHFTSSEVVYVPNIFPIYWFPLLRTSIFILSDLPVSTPTQEQLVLLAEPSVLDLCEFPPADHFCAGPLEAETLKNIIKRGTGRRDIAKLRLLRGRTVTFPRKELITLASVRTTGNPICFLSLWHLSGIEMRTCDYWWPLAPENRPGHN